MIGPLKSQMLLRDANSVHVTFTPGQNNFQRNGHDVRPSAIIPDSILHLKGFACSQIFRNSCFERFIYTILQVQSECILVINISYFILISLNICRLY